MLNIFFACRPFNLALLFISQILASYFLGFGNDWSDVFNQSHLVVYLTTIFCAAFGYLLNDRLDIIADVINKPKSSYLISTHSKKASVIVIIVLAIFAILLAFLVSLWYVKVIISILSLLVLYNFQLKRIPIIGNIVIALLGGFSILILLAFDVNLKRELIVIFTINSFGLHLIREIIKDAEDIRGDTEAGYKTFPILAGLKTTRVVLVVLLFVYILIFTTCIRIMMLHYFTPPLSYVFLSYNLLCIALPLFHLLSKLQSIDGDINYNYLNKVALYIMIQGTLMMLFF